MITLAKRGDLHSRRLLLSRLGQDKFIVHKLVEEIAPRYSERPGGYTRIVKLGPRRSPTRPRWSTWSWSDGPESRQLGVIVGSRPEAASPPLP